MAERLQLWRRESLKRGRTSASISGDTDDNALIEFALRQRKIGSPTAWRLWSGERSIEGGGSARAQCEPTVADGEGRGTSRRWGACRAAFSGARSRRVQGVARLLRDQATGDGYHCTCWSKTYSGCGWARASQSGTASAGGPRMGAIRGGSGSTGSPIWLRIR